MKKIVAFSLWNQLECIDKGQKIKCRPNVYNNGAIENAKLVKKFYPDWTARFYVNNTVPLNVQQTLKDEGAELIDMTGSKVPPMMQRFLPCGESDIECMICRDTDSRINQREVDATNDWLKSGKTLHVMRDHPHHNFKISGGMWGWRNSNKLYTNIESDIIKFMNNKPFARMDDMYFLYKVWDAMHGDIIAHDSVFDYPDSQPFPNDKFHKKKIYHNFIGEMYDEYNKHITYDRDIKLFQEMNFPQLKQKTVQRLREVINNNTTKLIIK